MNANRRRKGTKAYEKNTQRMEAYKEKKNLEAVSAADKYFELRLGEFNGADDVIDLSMSDIGSDKVEQLYNKYYLQAISLVAESTPLTYGEITEEVIEEEQIFEFQSNLVLDIQSAIVVKNVVNLVEPIECKLNGIPNILENYYATTIEGTPLIFSTGNQNFIEIQNIKELEADKNIELIHYSDAESKLAPLFNMDLNKEPLKFKVLGRCFQTIKCNTEDCNELHLADPISKLFDGSNSLVLNLVIANMSCREKFDLFFKIPDIIIYHRRFASIKCNSKCSRCLITELFSLIPSLLDLIYYLTLKSRFKTRPCNYGLENHKIILLP